MRSAQRVEIERALRHRLSCVCSVGCARMSFSARPNSGVGWNGCSPNVSISTRRLSRSPCRLANRAAIAPPSNWPDEHRRCGAGLVDQLAEPSEYALDVESVRLRSPRRRGPGGRERSRDAWPRAPGSRASSGQHKLPARGAGRVGGPLPPSSTAVEMPASSRRRSVTGIVASSARRAPRSAGARVGSRLVPVGCLQLRLGHGSSLRMCVWSGIERYALGAKRARRRKYPNCADRIVGGFTQPTCQTSTSASPPWPRGARPGHHRLIFRSVRCLARSAVLIRIRTHCITAEWRVEETLKSRRRRRG